MATKTSSPNILEYDPARCDALSEVLAERWWVVGLRGIFGIAFGLICLLVPAAAILALVLLFSAYMLVDGVLGIYSGIIIASAIMSWPSSEPAASTRPSALKSPNARCGS